MLSVFVRVAGCHLRCQWCDTRYAWEAEKGRERSIDEILDAVGRHSCAHVVVTGGEPLIARELPDLLQRLRETGSHVTLETSARQYRAVACDLVSISPKLAHSASDALPDEETQQEHRVNVEALRKFIDNHDYQLKFVVQGQRDLGEIEDILAQLPNVDRNNVFLMPQARTKSEHRRRGPLIAQMCIDHGFRFCPRLQIELWGRRRAR